MTQVNSVSDEDVLRWSRNLLDRRKVSDLDNFIQLRGITLPDLNDSSRRGRRGLIINKQEKIALTPTSLVLPLCLGVERRGGPCLC